MLKCHLSIINHSSITQFDDISLSNHDFDRVAGPDFHNVSGTESRPDLSLQTDFNDTYYSVYSQAQHQVCRVTERSLCRLHKDRANSCPDIVQQLNRDSDHLSNSNWRFTTMHERLYPDPYYLKNDQQTQTEISCTLQECIPVGCELAAHRPYAGVCFLGGFSIRGGSTSGGVFSI